jgi:uncharacterized protein YbgA (DUF1722 family)/uncharacterized protein YbbK (DUF523 family)
VFPKPRIVISKCIGFDPCRYNGEIVQDKFVPRLDPHVEFICVCPEVEIGLGTPRPPIRIVTSGKSFKLIQPSTGLDVSERMRGFSAGFLDDLQEVDGFILKNRSPSCGITDVKLFGGPEKGPVIGKTAGFFGGAVIERFGDRAIEDEGRLKNLNIREHFLTRVFAFARLRRLQESGSTNALVKFQAANKLLLMAYNQTKMRELGRIVANADRKNIGAVRDLYAKGFREALRKPPRHASPINVLMHVMGYFKKELSGREKQHFLGILEAYRVGRTPLSSAVSILRSWIMRFDSEYLRDQTFFHPFPEELVALDDSGVGRKTVFRSSERETSSKSYAGI